MVDFACLYESFDPARWLDADNPTYVDWQSELGLGDVKLQLVNSVQLMKARPVHRLFTGHRGGGKTTELKRVQQRLESGPTGSRYFVSFLDAEDAIDLDDVDPTDLVLEIVRQLVSDVRERLGIKLTAGRKLKAFLQAAREVLLSVPDAGVDLKVGDMAGIAELSTTLKRQPSVRRQIRRLIEGRMPLLFDAVNDELLPTLRDQLPANGYDGFVVIVDQLDRILAGDERHGRLFWEGRGKLKALDCHIVYTAPIEYASSRALPKLESEYGELLGLPLLPVTAVDLVVRASALDCMRQVVMARMFGCDERPEEVFEESGVLEDLLHLSGGHFRSLFQLMRTVIETSALVAPLRADDVSRVARNLASKYLDPLTPQERDVLRLVHATKRRPDDDRQLQCFFDLLSDQYVFAYVVGPDRWYDWNPLLDRSPLSQP